MMGKVIEQRRGDVVRHSLMLDSDFLESFVNGFGRGLEISEGPATLEFGGYRSDTASGVGGEVGL